MSRLEREKRDLGLLALLAVLIPAVWAFGFGWDREHAAAGHDALSQLLPFFSDLARAGGDWRALLYRPDLLGGVAVHGVFGSLPVQRLLARLGAGPLDCLNFSVFFFQLLYGFLAARAALDLGAWWSPERPPRPASWSAAAGLGLLCAFAPAAGWRLIYGHFNILVGGLVFVSAFALLAAAQNESLGFTLAVVAFLALAHSFQTFGHQLVLYGAVFGAPLLIALIRPGRRPGGAAPRGASKNALKRLALPVLLTAAAFLGSLPVFSGMLTHALSSDAGRALGGPAVTYSEGAARGEDWLGSLPWTVLKTGRDPGKDHDANYPFGPLLLLLALLPGSWAAAFLFSAGAAVLFSMKAQPLSSALLAAVPLLKSFRVPARAVLPALLVLPSLAGGALLASFRREWRPSALAWILPCAAALFFLPPPVRDAAAFALAAAAVLVVRAAPEKAKRWPAEALILLLALASVSAFKERLFGFWPEQALLQAPAAQREALRRAAPELASPLTRALLSEQPHPLQMNKGYALGVSSLDGHWSPQKRFLELYFALRGEAPLFNATSLQLRPSDAAFAVLRLLYNVRYAVDLRPSPPSAAPLPPAAGEAWFSRASARAAGFAELGRRLNELAPRGPAALAGTLWTVESDPFVAKAGLPDPVPAGCAAAKVLSVEAAHGGQRVRVRTLCPARCPLTISTNFDETLRARSLAPAASWSGLTVFPAYGALTGVMVEPGVSEIVLEPLPSYVGAPGPERLAGLALLALAFWLLPRLSSDEAAAAPKNKKGKRSAS